MDAVRVSGRLRLKPLLEWVLAVAFLCGAVLLASLVVRELQGASSAVPASPADPPDVRLPTASIPPSVPQRAVSVPALPLPDGKQVRVGDTAGDVATRLGRSAESGRQEVDGGPRGERLTRFYEYAGSTFILVFESESRPQELQVTSIYLVSRPNPTP